MRWWVVLTLIVIGLFAILPGMAAGQANESGGNETDERTEVVGQIGGVIINDYSYNKQTEEFSIDLEAERPETVTATEMVDYDSGGAQQIGIRQVRVLDPTTLVVDVSKEGPRGVILTTEKSVENGRALALQVQPGSSGSIAPIPFTVAGSMIAIASASTAVVTAIYVYRKQNTDKEGVERIA